MPENTPALKIWTLGQRIRRDVSQLDESELVCGCVWVGGLPGWGCPPGRGWLRLRHAGHARDAALVWHERNVPPGSAGPLPVGAPQRQQSHL